jgi:RNA polymerase sigma-70 factor (ECF subfamily)
MIRAVGTAETQRILRNALKGGDAARGALLERLRPRLVLWSATRLSPALRAKIEPEDVAQEILLALHKSLDGFEGTDERQFFAWVFRLAENRIRDLADHFGAQKRQMPEHFSFTQTSPSMAAARNEAFLRLHGALASLPESFRQVIQLRRIEGRDVPECAQILGRSENAVRILYCRALQALRRSLPEG